MKLSDLMAIVIVVVALFSRAAGVGSLDIPAPTATEKTAVAKITPLLKDHGQQARELASYYHAAAEAVRRDGAGAKTLKSTSNLRSFGERAVTVRFQGTFQKIPGLADAIHGSDGALAKMLGLAVVPLDHEKAATALDAVAWSCKEAVK